MTTAPMRFDWYAATVPDSPGRLLSYLQGSVDLATLEPSRPLHGYREAAQLIRGPRVLARAMWGGSTQGEGVHVWSSGDDAEWLACSVRHAYVEHRVTRVDVAADFVDGVAWERLAGAALSVADRYKLKVQHCGDYHRGEDGRTLYVGSPASALRLRVYEKGKQLGAAPEWVRAELQVRPQKQAKERAAALPAGAFWGAAAWSRAFAAEWGAELTPVPLGTIWRPQDDDRTWQWIIRQAGPLLRRMAERDGGWQAVADRLGKDLGVL